MSQTDSRGKQGSRLAENSKRRQIWLLYRTRQYTGSPDITETSDRKRSRYITTLPHAIQSLFGYKPHEGMDR